LVEALADRYRVERQLGTGGMAAVYLAEDLRHHRRVAVKVLHPELSAVLGPERFLREIEVTARLQHPHILPLFDSGEVDGQLYYVMPYVEGETLRARLQRETQLPVADAVRIAGEVADALDYAHRHGVVHRDVKPENVLLYDGHVVVADFGIAIAVAQAGGERMTQTGLSLGTPQYMSPEQAMGEKMVDARTDIYALGVITYEMLAGDPPFTGASAQAIVARVLTERPRGVREHRETVPVHVERALERALARLPADRFGTVREFAHALSDTSSADRRLAQLDRSRSPDLVRRRAALAAGALAVAVAAGVAGWMWGRRAGPHEERVVRYTLTLPASTRAGSSYRSPVSISPDGRMIAYIGAPVAEGEVWLRRLDEEHGRPIVGSGDAFAPQFSADGRWLLWFASSRLTWLKAPVAGGPATPVVQTLGPVSLAFYGRDSVIYAPQGLDGNGHLVVASLDGGGPARFLRDDSTAASSGQWDPAMAPDGRTVLFVSRRRDGGVERDELAYATLEDRRVHRVLVAARNILGYTAGAIVYVQDDGTIMALPFDLRRHVARGSPVATGDVAQLDAYGANAALSANGDLVFRGDTSKTRAVLVGGGMPASEVIAGGQQISFPRYSPDGRRIAISLATGTRTDVWIYTIASGSRARLTTAGSDNQRPEWANNGRYVLYRSNRSGQQALWWQPADGSGAAEQLSPRTDLPVHEGVISPDGRALLYRVDDTRRARDIYVVSLAGGDREPRPFLTTDFDEFAPRFSPNGKWVAYVSNESGRDEVYVRPFPGPSGRVVISDGGGEEPLWSRDGNRIFYRGLDVVVAASVSFQGEPLVTARDTVARGSFLSNRFHPMYDLAPDGKRLLMLQGSGSPLQLTVELNWARALKERLAAPR
jgi:serine/threonine-protein kinase